MPQLPADLTEIPFDPEHAPRELWDRYHTFRRARHAEVNPDDPVEPDHIAEQKLIHAYPEAETHRYLLHDASERIVSSYSGGWQRAGTPGYESNRRFMYAGASVLPMWRRHGIGTHWLGRTLDLMDEADKSVLTIWTEEESGHRFLRHIGAEQRTEGEENRLDLRAVDWEMVEHWADDGAARAPEVALELYPGRLPDGLLEPFSAAMTTMLNQMPFDDLEHGDMVVSADHMRQVYDRLDATDTRHDTYLTRETDGTISGITDIHYTPAMPDRVSQRFTGVHPDYQGRGQGKRLKAAMLLHIREAYPEARWVITGNAASNAPMLSINRRLGFRTHRGDAVYQMTRDALAAYLASR